MDAMILACPDWLEGVMAQLSLLSFMDAEHYERAQAIMENCILQLQFFIHQLYIPDSHLYWRAGQAALYDSYQAMQSVSYWIFLTLRPIILCCYWLTFYFIYYVIYKFILVQGLYHHGLSQGKEILLSFWRWECSLSHHQLLLQAVSVILLYGLYQLQQFLKRRRYLYKLNLYMDHKKQMVIKSYHSVVQRIASISLLLAVMTPHVLFLATAIGLKCLMPRSCSSLVHSRGVRDILSWWYPLICTLLLLLDADSELLGPEMKQNGTTATTTASVDKENSVPKIAQSSSTRSQKEKASSSSSRTPEQRRKRPLTKNISSTFSPFPRTTPTNVGRKTTTPVSSSPSPRRWNRTTTPSSSATLYYTHSQQQQRPRRRRRQSLATPLRIMSQQQHHYLSSPTTGNDNHQQQAHQQQQQHALTLQEQEADWLRFWIVRGTVQALKVWFAWLTPVWLQATLFHLEVLFYLWIYIMPYLQPESIISNGRYELPEGRPLQVLHDTYVQPAVEFLHETISGAVPKDTWDTYIVQNVRRILSGLVLVWMIQQETADAILHVVEESRSLVVPAVTLFMPYFVTAYGVVYVQYGLSIAKSTAAIIIQQQEQQTTTPASSASKSCCQRWLSYWVLHCTFVAILYRLQGLLWWIPFSTHVIFCLWCTLSIPRNIDYLYNLTCDELRAFSILPPKHIRSSSGSSSSSSSNDKDDDNDDSVVVAWQETKTAKCLQWIWERLPKANNNNNNADDYHQQDLFASFNSTDSNDNNNNHDDAPGQDEPNDDNDKNAPPDSQESPPLGDTGGAEESEQEEDDDDDLDVIDKNELNDDDYVPPSALSTTSSSRNNQDVVTAASALRRSTRVGRKSRNS